MSFIGAKWNEDKTELVDHALHTILIQDKGYFTASIIANAQVRDTKERVYHKLLDIPFGENHVYCVACSKEKFPNAFNKSEIDELDGGE
eukprot:CAMPEP_0198123212 /NCGR_PEP_ID=MMETSP1442-20131203/37001_1 /TAXON_ID= /ORGANISM="Craspedostauros australis, Strain CCMP3328" /LENGTH=88 /DNA_ID=CAMNT_0043782381 /DNA_START=25 /DNA_END=291 /DNA_ORIENTATION=+